jgi:GntR family transcriptional regulator
MFVTAGARKQLETKYRTKFQADFIGPLVRQAQKLGISSEEIIRMIEKENH